MAKRLDEMISSKYLEAANRLRSKSARRRIVAYVESYDDIFFWRSVLTPFENEHRYFEVMLPSHKRLERGKKSVLMNLLAAKVGEDMIACVDADYDWLIQGVSPNSRLILENKYVFHTYAYAIENLQCYAPSLHNVCVMATLNDSFVFNIEEFMRQFSSIIFPLFVWNIMFYRSNRYKEFSITQFCEVAELGGLNLNDPEASLNRLRKKVHRAINQLQQNNPNAKEPYLKLKAEMMEEMGITPETTYLYIQGHHLFDKIVVPMLKKVCNHLTREREREIQRQAVHDTQRRNELACYRRSVQDVEQMLKKNTEYLHSEPVLRLRNDLENLLNGRSEDELSDPSRTQE